MTDKSIKVIIDTNVWISFLIGKRLKKIKNYIANVQIVIVTSEQLLLEIQMITRRKKLKKYFPKESVIDLLELLSLISEKFEVESKHSISKDPKDDFLFDLIDTSNADYLVSGDKGVLEHKKFKSAKILSPSEFEKEIIKFS